MNIRGGGNVPRQAHNKWNQINHLQKDRGIGVLAVQETHLTEAKVVMLHRLYSRRMHIMHTQDPEQPTQCARVAIVLNREKTNIKGVKKVEIVPRRAILVTIPWHLDLTVSILAIYAPNAANENKSFWKKIHVTWNEMNLPTPDLILGDFNVVENAIDHLPTHPDNGEAVVALVNLKLRFLMYNGWRDANQTSKGYTYTQDTTGLQSRIDRIYAAEGNRNSLTRWQIDPTSILTDHHMISTTLVNRKSPYIGDSRWTLPLFLLEDKTFMEEIHDLGCKLNRTLRGITDDTRGPSDNTQGLPTSNSRSG